MFPGGIYSEKNTTNSLSWPLTFMKFKKTFHVEDWMKNIFILCKLLSPANNEKLSMNTYYITYRFLEFLYKVYNNQHL